MKVLYRLRKIAPFFLVLLATAVAVGADLQALNYPFVSDDNVYINEQTRLSALQLTELWRLFTEPYNDFSEFLPIRDLSYWLDMALFGFSPSAFRIHNIALYLLCLPLVYANTLQLWRYFRPAEAGSATWLAAAVTALFALNPSHVEAVVWVSGRKDLLSGLFSLLALWLAMRARNEKGLSAPYAAGSLIALLVAMLSKATAIAVAPVIALIWLMYWRDISEPIRHRLLLLWPVAIILMSGFVAMVFSAVIPSKIPLYFGIEAVNRSLAVLGWLARLTVSPESRHFYYPVFEDPNFPFMVALGASVIAAAAAGLIMLWRKRSLEGFAVVAFLSLCITSIQLIPYAPPSLVSDRFIFLAMWPAIILLVSLVWRLGPAFRWAVLLIMALSWTFQTVERPGDWRSVDALIGKDVYAYPGNHMPVILRMSVLMRRGDYGDADAVARTVANSEYRNILVKLIKAAYDTHVVAVAEKSPQKAMSELLTIFPEMKIIFPELKQQPDETKWNGPFNKFLYDCRKIYDGQWEFLLSRFPGDVSLRYNAGLLSLQIHRYKEAAEHLREAINMPGMPESARGAAFKNLGMALVYSKRFEEAGIPLRAALEQTPPDYGAHCLLALVHRNAGRKQEAERAESECRSGLARD